MSLSTEAELPQVDADSVASVPFKKWKYGAGLPPKKRHYFLADLSTTAPQVSSAPKEHDLPIKEETMPDSELLPGLTELSLTPSQLSPAVPKEPVLPAKEQSLSESKLDLSGIGLDASPQNATLTNNGRASIVKHENSCMGEDMLADKAEVAQLLKISSQDMCAREIVNHEGSSDTSLSSSSPFTSEWPLKSKVPSVVPSESPTSEEKTLIGLTRKSENVAESSNIQISLGESFRLQSEERSSEQSNCAEYDPSQLFLAVPNEPALPIEEQSVSESKLSLSGIVHDASLQNGSLTDNNGHTPIVKHENSCIGEDMLADEGEVTGQLKISSQDLCAREIVNHEVSTDFCLSNTAPLTSEWLSISKVPSVVVSDSPTSEEKTLSGLTCKSENVVENSNIQISLGESFRLQSEELLSKQSNCTLNKVVCSEKKLDFLVPSTEKVSLHSEGAEYDPQTSYGSSSVNRSHWDLNTTMDTWDGPVSDSKKKLLMERVIVQPNGRSLGSSLVSVKEENGGAFNSGISMAMGKHVQKESSSNLSSLSTLGSKELEKSQTLSFSSSFSQTSRLDKRKKGSIQGENLFSGMSPNLPLSSPCSLGSRTKAVSSIQGATSRSLSDLGENSSLSTTVEAIRPNKKSNLLHSRSVKSEPVEDIANGGKSNASVGTRHNIPIQGTLKSELLNVGKQDVFPIVKPEPVDGILKKLDEHTESSKLNIQKNTSTHKSPMNGENTSSPAASVVLFDVTPGSIGSASNEPLARNKINCVNASINKFVAVGNQHVNPCSTISDTEIKKEYILNKSHVDSQWGDGGYAKFSNSLGCTNSTIKSHDADDDFEDGEFREASLINDESMTSEYVINHYQDPVEGQCSTSLDNENTASPMPYAKSLSRDKDLTESPSFSEDKDKTGNMVSSSSPVTLVEKSSTNFVNAMDTNVVRTLVTEASSSRGAVEAHKPESAKKKPVRALIKTPQNATEKGERELVSAKITSDMPHDTKSSHAENKTSSRLQCPPRIDGERYLEKTGELPARPMRNEGRKKVYHHVRVRNQDQPSGVSGSESASTRGRFDSCVDSFHDKRTLNRDYISEPYNSVSAIRFSGPRSTAIAVASGLETDKLSRRERFTYNNVGIRSDRKLSSDELLDFSCLPPRRQSPVDIDVEPGPLDMRLCQGSLREVSPDRFVGRSPRQYDRDEPFVRRDRRSFSPLQRRGTCRISGVRTRSPQRPRNCSPGPRSSPRKRSPGRMGRHHVLREERVRSPPRIFEDMVNGRLRGSPLRQRMICSPRRREASRSFVSSRSNSRYDKIDLRGREDEYLESMHPDRFHEFAGNECIDDEGRGTSGRYRHDRAFRSFNDESDYEDLLHVDYPYGIDGDRPCRPSPESDVDFHDQIRSRGFEGRIRKGMGYHSPRLRSMEEEEDNARCNRRWLESSFNEDRRKRSRF